jgi:hypothetical protein
MNSRRVPGHPRFDATRRAHAPLRVVALAAALALCAAQAATAGIQIVGPEQVLARHTRIIDGRLYLTVPGIAPQELVTSVDDPTIANQGDGSFHPVDPTTVANAIAALAFPVDQVDAVVYVLPYPRRAGLESAAAPGACLLSPGTRPVDAAQVHAVVAHEMGHLIQYQFAPEGSAAWAAYARLRGFPVGGSVTLSRATPLNHIDRPREVFAEDFRALLGSPLARANGSVENTTLASPYDIEELASLLQDLPHRATRTALAGSVATGRPVAAFPNPFRASVTLAVDAAASPAPATPGVRGFTVFDVRGRAVRHESVPATGDGSATWRWDGTGDDGVRLAPGAYFVAAEGEIGRATRIVLTR